MGGNVTLTGVTGLRYDIVLVYSEQSASLQTQTSVSDVVELN
jgi:hypothetical protein